MNRPFFGGLALAAALVCASCFLPPGWADSPQAEKKPTWAIVVHGGAGNGGGGAAPAAKPSAREEMMATYLRMGSEMLAKGDSALDTCEKVVRAIEDSGNYNAGKGAYTTGGGKHSLDAGIMDGSNLKFGSVAGVQTVKNPVVCARMVMEKSKHVMLLRDGAEEFAAKMGLEIVPSSYFGRGAKKKDGKDEDPEEPHGTVGCVCLDQKGNLAAATSTGGIGVVLNGRVGGVPICGSCTYANNKTCAVSGTGSGEDLVRNVVGHTVSALMEYKGLSAQKAADEVIFNILPKEKGGIIVVSQSGEIAMPFNTTMMARGAADSSGRFEIGIGKQTRKDMSPLVPRADGK
jgi:beta-aspartyl-peptidase (threonine type)